MAKIVTISGAPFRPRGWVLHSLASLAARKAVKAQWLAAGKHRYSFGVAELRLAGEFYLQSHPELFEEAEALIKRDPILKKMDEAWRKRYAQSIGTDHAHPDALVSAEITSDAQRKSR
jgi:hypothetical protein